MSAFLRYLPRATLVVAVVTAAAAWPLHAWAGADGVTALVVAGAVCLAGAFLGRLPHLFFHAGPDAFFHAALAGLGARLLGTLACAVPILLAADLAQVPLAVCLLIHYLALLLLEVHDLLARSHSLPTSAAAPHAEVALDREGVPTR